jgi:hypothetical protein
LFYVLIESYYSSLEFVIRIRIELHALFGIGKLFQTKAFNNTSLFLNEMDDMTESATMGDITDRFLLSAFYSRTAIELCFFAVENHSFFSIGVKYWNLQLDMEHFFKHRR